MTKQLQGVQVEREELVVAERVLNRLAEQVQADAGAVASAAARVAGRTVRLIPHRRDAPVTSRARVEGPFGLVSIEAKGFGYCCP
ncbi:hypothetical protein ACWDE9_30530 [Streptomyces olivaceoviridis]|uniref:hypothetical protein n=1 Tax=Streptomyces olivaceoviridis TaxID=1921 RepID=UPI0019B50A70|nr:hypothetical protein [Streptomyces olivaceoviridis]GGZ30938.1 hypothetical protein GCM10010300_86810 [Streptomyces olivaceoviridis]